MAIKKKDGTDYKLVGPNPIASKQEFWDAKNLILHNVDWNPVKLIENDAPVEKKEPEIPKAEEFIQKLQATEPEPQPVVFEPTKEVVETQVIKNKITVWCYKAITTVETNSLYGESYKRRAFGNKILMEAVIIDQTDFMIQIWTNVGGIPAGSIIYPQTQDKRWWMISEASEYEGGFIYPATISDITPAFD